MSSQPELPIDRPEPSADEKHREKCFEDLLLCVGEIVPLAEKISTDERDGLPGREAVDATMHTLIEFHVGLLENTVTTWQEES